MIKILLVFLLNIFVYANTLHFKEQRYIYALDTSTYNKGTIKFKEDEIRTSYKNSNDILIYTQNKLIVKNKQSTKEIDLTQNIQIKIFFLLIQAIYENNQQQLQEFFTLKKEKELTILHPKSSIENHISIIRYKKTDTLEFLKIEFVNQDRIIIEEID